MEHLTQGMKRKWDRHFSETLTALSWGLFAVGIVCFIVLTVIWPQKYSKDIFDQRLKFDLIIDVRKRCPSF
jgi:cobalamin biosynthesis protein CobD/CbiB